MFFIFKNLTKYPYGVYTVKKGKGQIMENCNCNQEKTIRNEETKKQLLSRINRILGQMTGVKKMIEEDRYCGDILIQLSAIEKSIKSLASVILDNHMHSCVVNGIKNGDTKKIDEIVELFKRFS